jgi:hypothetical protein
MVNICCVAVFGTTHQAVQMMQAFYVCRISTSVFFLDFHLVQGKAGFLCFLRWYPRGVI